MLKVLNIVVITVAILGLVVSNAFADPTGTLGQDGTVSGGSYLIDNTNKPETIRLSGDGGQATALVGQKSTVQYLYMNGGSLGQPYNGQEGYKDAGLAAVFSSNTITNLYYSASLASYAGRLRGDSNSITNFILNNSVDDSGSYTLNGSSLELGGTKIGSDSFATYQNFAIDNKSDASIGSVAQNGGTLTNSGSIANLIYNGGTLSGAGYVGNLTVNSSNSGELFASGFTIGAVTINGVNFDKNSFVSAKKLAFEADGSGYLKIGGFVDSENSLGFDFASKVTDEVDLSNGRLVVDISEALSSAVVGTDTENWANVTSFMNDYGLANLDLSLLFGSVAELKNWTDIDYLKIFWGSEDDQWFNIIDGGKFVSAGYSWAETGAVIAWSDPTPDTGAAAPEPATMMILGLGIAGLAIARRRKK